MPHSQLAAVIQSLGSRLDEGATPAVRTLRRDLQEQFEAVGNETTPYGKLMQHIDMGIPEAREVPFISPFALLFKVCRTSENSETFFEAVCVAISMHASSFILTTSPREMFCAQTQDAPWLAVIGHSWNFHSGFGLELMGGSLFATSVLLSTKRSQAACLRCGDICCTSFSVTHGTSRLRVP